MAGTYRSQRRAVYFCRLYRWLCWRLFQPRGRFDQHMFEQGPQRQNTVICRQMSAKSAVTLIRIAVEPDVLSEKVLECLLKWAGPMLRC
jgi:hypothetical protein